MLYIDFKETFFKIKNLIINIIAAKEIVIPKNKFLLISKEELLSQNILGVGENFKDLDSILGNYFFLSYSKYNLSEENCSTLVGAHAGITKKELELYLMVFNSK